MTDKHIALFRSELAAWYAAHCRDLPWRHTADPYLIWVSEVILQQTTVEQGMAYYKRFVEAYPTPVHLDAAPEQEVLRLWQGLGYYSRARNMKRTAAAICSVYGGQFPAVLKELLKLPGIGPYTAAAILSFAFGQPYPVADGNVLRVMARLSGSTLPVNSPDGLKAVLGFTEKLFDAAQPGLYNQAVMEFGALHCRVKNPLCADCFAAEICRARQEGIQNLLPVKIPKAQVRQRYFVYTVPVFAYKGRACTLLRKRTAKDIWHNLYDFPLLELPAAATPAEILHSKTYKSFLKNLFPGAKALSPVHAGGPVVHKLTHQNIHTLFFRVDTPAPALPLDAEYVICPLSDTVVYPLPRLIEGFLEGMKEI